ncbi:glycosyltransferase family 2 protein [Antarcticimicrobium luteum]|uniref:Glycosyltransferase family 2 protein n=1 Tax=Antarcticimicrobium luteum TaxID=2547397 RepID=A0A4R5VEP7_9RHOB|nr:glycosyltransferase family A protein [Antarcticimicrobium luteum]TDK50910.1 glycosyltransferase family 2 protein [Antarcticimicrobium luteum]
MIARSYSFVIPAYNDRDGIARHLEYFRGVADPVQLVIVDDCSEDDTADLVAAAEMPDHVEITYHRQAENGGPAAARNTGLGLATRDYAMFLDADDLLAPCFFDVMRLAPFGPGVDFVMFKHHLSTRADLRFTYDMHQVDRVFFSRDPHSPFPAQTFRLKERPGALATVNFPWNKLYRRAFLQRAAITFPDLRMHEDIAPHWQSFLRSESFGILYWAPPLLTHYEIPHADRATQYVGEKRMDVFAELSRIEDELLAHPDAGVLQPVFADFCDNLFGWLTGPLCAAGDDAARLWQAQYREAVEAFWEAAQTPRPGETA